MGCVFAGGASALGGARGGAAVGAGGAAGVLGWKEGCLETTPGNKKQWNIDEYSTLYHQQELG